MPEAPDTCPDVDGSRAARYTRHMKRTNLVLNEQLLAEALRLSGERTYSRAVERALGDFVRRIKAGRILHLAGAGLWEGQLGEIRRDREPLAQARWARRARRAAR